MTVEDGIKKHFKLVPNDHVFLLTTIWLLFLAVIYLGPWLLYFAFQYKGMMVLAYVALPIPLTSQYVFDQTDSFTTSFTGAYNTNVEPLVNEILDCLEPFRVLYNTITGIIRAMLHTVALNFYPLNRQTVLTVVANVLNLVLNFAVILLTQILALFDAIVSLFKGSVGGIFNFAIAIVNWIMADLQDVMDEGRCFHPLSEEPGAFIECISQKRLLRKDVNDAGFVGFVEGLVIVACGFGNYSVDFWLDIVLPCTGLDQFLIFKTYYFEVVGNVTDSYNKDVASFEKSVADFGRLSQQFAALGPAITKYIVRRICGGVAFFCKILKGLGIPARIRVESFNARIHLTASKEMASDIEGVCVYHSSDGSYVGCYYSNPKNFQLFESDGVTPVNLDKVYADLHYISDKMNNTLMPLLIQLGIMPSTPTGSVNDTLLIGAPGHINTAPLRQRINDLHTGRVPPSRISRLPNEFPHYKGRSASFKRMGARMDDNFKTVKSNLETHLAGMDRTRSGTHIMLAAAHHGMKAMSVAASALYNFRTIKNPYMYTMDALEDIGFNITEVIEMMDNHVEKHHPQVLQKSGFTIAVTMSNLITTVVLSGFKGFTGLALTVMTMIMSGTGYMVMALGSAGGFLNHLLKDSGNFDFGANYLLVPFIDWTDQFAQGAINSSSQTTIVAEKVIGRLPIVLEFMVLQVVRGTTLCNIPYPGVCPPQIGSDVIEDPNAQLFDITVTYIVNLTLCVPDFCDSGSSDEFGNPCIDGTIYCWLDAPPLRLPNIAMTLLRNNRTCTYNGTRFTDGVSPYWVPINWLKYTYTDGLQFVLRMFTHGYSLNILLIVFCYIFGLVCFCFRTPMRYGIYIIFLQYPTYFGQYVTTVCPSFLIGASRCDAFRDWITFPNGEFEIGRAHV